jgi:formate C-acetyltransferase
VKALRSGVLEREGEFHQWFSLWAESLAETEGEPVILRRAKAFAHMLERMPLEIPDGALIVGRHPKTILDESEAKRIREEWARVADPPDDATLHYQTEGLFRAPIITLHLAPDSKKALSVGLGGLCEGIRNRLRAPSISSPLVGEDKGGGKSITPSLTLPHSGGGNRIMLIASEVEGGPVNATPAGEQEELAREFLSAALICIEAASRFILRHADSAEQLAAVEKNETRKRELKELAGICRQIVKEPPDSFYSALQLLWFIYLLVNLESGHMMHCAGPGTLDRWLIEFYRKDIEAGRLAPEQALELLECFFVEMNASLPRGGILPLAIGGLGAGGVGAENELTRLCLKAVNDLRMLHPSLALRYHRNMPRELLRAALRSIGSGSTYPALFNDEVCVPSLRRSGVSEEDAWDWVHSICTELTAAGKTNAWIAAPYLNLAKCLELTLNHGRCLLTGEQLGEDLGDLTTYADFEELYSAYYRQVSHIMSKGVEASICNQHQAKEKTPYPFLSCFTADCLEKGGDFTAGGARYNPDYIQGIGLSTTADSLAAIRHFVFDNQMIPPELLLAALKTGFRGFEDLRQRLLNKAPKYGNDDDCADGIFVRLVEDFYAEAEKHTNGRGGPCLPGFMTWESHNLLGKGTGASADGRLARAALSDSVGAVQGMDRKGLTALLKSVTKSDYLRAVGGVTFNIKVSPEMFSRDDMLERLEAALVAYFEAGGFQVQVNVLSRRLLEEARDRPDLHPNLMVRVGGFSAYFVELDRGLQEEIIARTAH